MGFWLVRGNGTVVLWTESMDFDYIQGAPQPAEGKLAPYFFYHMKKTGGIAVFSSSGGPNAHQPLRNPLISEKGCKINGLHEIGLRDNPLI